VLFDIDGKGSFLTFPATIFELLNCILLALVFEHLKCTFATYEQREGLRTIFQSATGFGRGNG